MPFNYVDLVALFLLVSYLVSGYMVGLWRYLIQVVSLVAGLSIALLFYIPLSTVLLSRFAMQPVSASALAFITLMIGTSLLIGTLLKLILMRFPTIFTEHWYTRIFALIPAAVEAAISIILLILVSPVLPLPTNYTEEITASYVGTLAAQELPAVTRSLNTVSGGRLSVALAQLTAPHEVEDDSVTKLTHRPAATSVNHSDESQMLVLMNEERAKVGASSLTMDPALTLVAEAHSKDMWDRQYFAHVNPDGKDPFARMLAAGIDFLRAGENIALAPTLSAGHTGLMNSPGHRRNILDPKFHKVGIGIIDGGIYGKMFTQDFTD